jgi:hypothetical protein
MSITIILAMKSIFLEILLLQLGTVGPEKYLHIRNFFGFPYCWSEYFLDGGKGAGTQVSSTIHLSLQIQWAQDEYSTDGTHRCSTKLKY